MVGTDGVRESSNSMQSAQLDDEKEEEENLVQKNLFSETTT